MTTDEMPDALDELDTKKERYTVLRLAGCSDREANERVGYAGKTPGDAIALYEKAQSAKMLGEGEIERFREEIDKLQRKIQQRRQSIRAWQVWRTLQSCESLTTSV